MGGEMTTFEFWLAGKWESSLSICFMYRERVISRTRERGTSRTLSVGEIGELGTKTLPLLKSVLSDSLSRQKSSEVIRFLSKSEGEDFMAPN